MAKTTRKTPADSLPQKVRDLRAAAGLTQEALAKKAKVSRLTVVNVEGAKVEASTATLKRIAKALSVELGELLGAA